MTVADDILVLLRSDGPLTDAQIRIRLRLVHQQVNQACRQLAAQKRVIRETGPDGTIINRLIGQPAPPPAAPPVIASDAAGLLSEDEVKAAVKDHLEERGYTVEVRWGRAHGIDIEAHSADGRILIEAKGEVASQQQQTNYFLGALGELVQRMNDPAARYGLALPDNKVYCGLVQRLPQLARERLQLTVFFVERDGDSFAIKDYP